MMTGPPPLDDILRQRRRRIKVWSNESYAALALVAATIVALVWANIGNGYDSFWDTMAGFEAGPVSISLSLHEWVNEGLMALFFFMVGLDVRRELAIGDLRLPGRALLPVAAALGGLIVPALVFLAIAGGSASGHAWGAVISTDTAFALGMLALVGPRSAPRLRLFLLALAVIDDIGALTVIGIFYTDDLNLYGLGAAFLCLAAVWILQRRGVWRVAPYLVLGVLTWAAIYSSGVHATLAGVLIALLMPVHTVRDRDVERTNEIYHLFRQAPTPSAALLTRDALVYSIPLNQRLSAVLPRYVNYLVVPVFALANAGIAISGETLEAAATSSLTWGIVAGLVIGKLVGITLVGAIVLRFAPSSRIPGVDLPRLAGIGALSGVGFTISLLVVDLAVADEAAGAQARLAVLIASVVALSLAILIFRIGDHLSPAAPARGDSLRRPVDLAHDHVRGQKNPSLSLVAYAAMNVSYRTRTQEALREAFEVIDRRNVQLVYRHQSNSDNDTLTALALEAASKQGKFWELHDALLHVEGPLDRAIIHRVALDIGLDATVFDARIRSGDDNARIDDDLIDIDESDIDGETILYLNGTRVDGPINRWGLVEAMRERLTQDGE